MKKEELKSQLTELIQTVDAFFGRDTATRARAAFKKHRAESLEQIPQMGDLLKQYPAFGAIAFLGKFQFTECTEVASLEKESSIELLEKLQKMQAVKLAESARSAWNFLMEHDKEALCAILSLCYMARKNAKIKKALATP